MENASGKLLVYTSAYASREERLKSINLAAEEIAKLLELNVEIITFEMEFTPIYVYYKGEDGEQIPVYCNRGGKTDMDEVFASLKRMLYVLSFHPKYSALKRFRKEIMPFS